jgi:hypothetical protein
VNPKEVHYSGGKATEIILNYKSAKIEEKLKNILESDTYNFSFLNTTSCHDIAILKNDNSLKIIMNSSEDKYIGNHTLYF